VTATAKVRKQKVAIYKMSSCAGCQLEFLNLEPVLLDLLGIVDLSYFVMARRQNQEGPYDVGFVEGAITAPEEIARLKKARNDCRVIVALGTCAAFGGLPSIKNWTPQRAIEERVYPNVSFINSVKARGIDEYVRVDAYLKGCPVNKEELLDFIKSTILGIVPYLRPHSVCVECKLNEYECLAVTHKEPCMGPVTNAGCGALCPGRGKSCEGCRGPAKEANAPSLARTFMQNGLRTPDIVRKFRKFAGTTEEFEKGVL